MKIIAKPVGKENATAKRLKNISLSDKNVTMKGNELRISTRVDIDQGTSGEIRLAIALTKGEVMELAARALTGQLEGRIADLETKATASR